MRIDLKSKYSCKRKRDYVTLFAVMMFSLIVLFELYLVFWLPIQLRRENAMVLHVSRQRIAEFADNLRSSCRGLGKKDSLEKGEYAMIQSTLDVLAIYIRENQEHLNMSQLRELEQTMNRIARIIDGWRNNRFLIRRNSFNTAPLQKALEEKLHRFDKQLPQKLN